jgi:FMN phosphatase YigB (HAD superfamily)
MGKSIAEYLDWLDGRHELMWPKPPAIKPLNAKPSCNPLPGVKVVLWDVYGTLLSIVDGDLVHRHRQQVRVQVALEKTIQEFNMWYSMTRKPGQPWEYMLQQYSKLLEDAGMVGNIAKGDTPEIDSAKVWGKILERLVKHEYTWDAGLYGNQLELAEKIAYFFHANQQGVVASPDAAQALELVLRQGRRQGLLANAQSFTVAQLQRALREQNPDLVLRSLLHANYLHLSMQYGVRIPSPTLLARVERVFKQSGVLPENVLVVSCRLKDHLDIAKKFGFRTALYAADANACQVDAEDLKNPELRPDRLLTDLIQISDVLSGE